MQAVLACAKSLFAPRREDHRDRCVVKSIHPFELLVYAGNAGASKGTGTTGAAATGQYRQNL
jgi:hypothetical protein